MNFAPTSKEPQMQTEAERAEKHNADLYKLMAARRETRGFTVVQNRGAIHAARSTVKGHGGYVHPRPLCQSSTSLHYFGACGNQDLDMTCKRCAASLAKNYGVTA